MALTEGIPMPVKKKTPAPISAPDPNKLLSVKAVAAQLGVSAQLVYQFVRDGRLDHVNVGRLVRIRQSAVDAMLEEAKCN
jgi:excisionase family DNA binding protein